MEASDLPRNRYRVLGDREFRVISITPGQPDSVLSCILTTQSLDHIKQPYAALSYTWGNPADKVWLLCANVEERTSQLPEGKKEEIDIGRIQVTRNLIAALKQMRAPDSSIVAWVDAVCINQEDVEERDRQLLLMREIYALGQVTHIWLGEASENSGHGMDFITEVYDAPHLGSQRALVKNINEENIALQKRQWAGLREILHRPWFTRIWVRQEVIFSVQAQLACGEKVVPWKVFQDSVSGLLQMNASFTDTLEPMHGLHHTEMITFLRELAIRGNVTHVRETLDNELLVILSACRECGATVAKDKVIAVLGLCSIALQELLPHFSFSQTAETVFVRVVLPTILIYKSLNFLSHAGMNSATASKLTLPSWVPDWSIPWDVAVIDTPLPDHKYRAAGETEPKMDCYDPAKPHLLVVSGKIVDEITMLADKTPSFSHLFHSNALFTADDKQYAIYNWAKRIQEMSSTHKHSPVSSDIPSSEAVWRTLIADKSDRNPIGLWQDGRLDPDANKGNRAPAEYVTSFKDWCWFNMAEPKEVEARHPADYYYREQNLLHWRTAMARTARNRRFAVTRKHYMVLGPDDCRVGDVVAVLFGGNVPYVLRSVEDGRYRLIAECYVHGLMDGEALVMTDLETRDFILE